MAHAPRRFRRPRRRLVLSFVAVLAVLTGGAVSFAVAGQPAPVHREDRMLAMPETPGSSRTVRIDTSFFTSGGPGRRPAVLLAHGFGGSKDDMTGQAEQLARSGYAVLTWSARGFGRSTGAIGLDAPDREVADVRRLVDWLGHRPDVQLDGPDDPRVGIAGASYGGAIALLAAGYDKRVDAIAPQITWWNLAESLFPQGARAEPADSGVFKKLWSGIFFTTASAGSPAGPAPSTAPGTGGAAGRTGPGGGAGAPGGAPGTGTTGLAGAVAGSYGGTAAASSCRFTAELCAMYQRVAVEGHADEAAVRLLTRSSPASVGDRIKVPTLLLQGQNDSLFPLGQADEAARAIAANGAPVAVDWTAGGHDGGDPEGARVDARVTAWFDHYLKHTGAATGPAFRVTRAGGIDTTTGDTVLRGATAGRYPGLDGTGRRQLVLIGGPQNVSNPAGGDPPAISALPGVGALSALSSLGQGVSLDFPGQQAVFDTAPLTEPLRMTGSPQVRITVGSDAPDGEAVLFGKVYDVGPDGRASLPHQLAAPLRVTGAGPGGSGNGEGARTVTVTLPAVDHSFAAGHRLRLVFSATDLAYSSPVRPATYRVALAGDAPGLVVPTDPALTTGTPGIPVWVWVLPAVAVAVAAALLLTGRVRRRRSAAAGDPVAPPRPADGDVPLRVSGLAKRYRGAADRYAVRDVSFEVARGQVVGLLGPNGAGKTTTMRMIMGLIRPDAGEIQIFGRPVTAGAPVLSRVGAFVEGSGFLPHLTGRANLDLYWRATGRPAAESHTAEALEIAGLGEALDRPVRTYSQGMRQRLAIAQAMLGLPDLLILDEPTNGLDPPQIREMRAMVTRYAATGRTVIVSSHLLSEVEQSCTHLVVMDKGGLVAAGPVAEITGDGSLLAVGVAGADAGTLTATAAKVAGLAGVAFAQAAEDGLLIRLEGMTVPELLAELLRLEVAVERVGPHRRLEDAFLSLIGGAA
ncbi:MULTISPECIES: alpha/beta fold hydrolase [Streptomycetaceae]|uniref:ABC transporter ATP-binding protein n=1 Tax=Streptantibioticus cattleyicolor (strain ATCC 35852 / DSM 46488 / JCM 4925 / NBRC 14057 / NRRL 8057) TaxID=1003195 RepID=F8JZN9_STREN|nr:MULTISPECIES: alpha/beta fold hydrolase [Streptomycetaceae]AEW97342.1 ABC transporter ATP-binding protein [Streptantibioticus cattleyicolor NRRL 8057 = DSM 46488]MYS61792.1 alpha/beta fold hydrolase [Streptomyces sp. SID5468]CCB77664.1 putative ABC transporter ATP-binding protein [Streptantibioticus cattleyicolor NRRL 8057 = DSM 46488]